MASPSRFENIQERPCLPAGKFVEDATFHAVFDQGPKFTGIMTLDGILIEANRTWLESGYPAAEILGHFLWETPLWRQNQQEVGAKIRDGVQKAAQGNYWFDDLPYIAADGSERIVAFRISPIRNEGGEIAFLCTTALDITDQKSAERTLLRELEERNADVLRQSALLHELSQRLISVQDSERRYISRELHDSAGQLLAVLSFTLESFGLDIKAGKKLDVAERLNECHQLTQQIIREIRTMSYLLHPPSLDELGLASALEIYTTELGARSGIEIELNLPPDLPRLPNELEMAIFRVVQECLTNIHRHSGSKTAGIHLLVEDETLRLEVHDSGKGISAEKLEEINTHNSGVGIQSVRERIRPYQGSFHIESGDGGTVVYANFTVPKAQSATAGA